MSKGKRGTERSHRAKAMERTASIRDTWARAGHAVNAEEEVMDPVPVPCMETIQREFPGAVPACKTKEVVPEVLQRHGMLPDKTILCSSICSDEINREKSSWCHLTWGENFALGGIAGLPFAGKTGFKAFASHVPDEGGLFLFVASHVGVNQDGAVGKVRRHGQCKDSSSCGAGVAGLAWALEQPEGCVLKPNDDQLDYQMETVKALLLRNIERIKSSPSPQADVARVLYEECISRVKKIVPLDCHYPIAVMGGYQINTDDHLPDFLLAKDFFIVKDGQTVDVKEEFLDAVRRAE